MKKPILIALVVVVVVVVVALGGILGTQMVNQPSPSPTPAPAATTADDAGTAAFNYLLANHTEVAAMAQDINWTGGRQDTGLVGSDTYIYISGLWNITITNPVVPNPIYTVSIVYNDAANKVSVTWEGTCQSSNVTETNYAIVTP